MVMVLMVVVVSFCPSKRRLLDYIILPEWIPILSFKVSSGEESDEILKFDKLSNSSKANVQILAACRGVGSGTPDATM